MPKMHKDFPDQLSLSVTKEMKQNLIAIGYQLGTGGGYASATRNLLKAGIESYVENLDQKKRADFDMILNNVKAREIIK